MVEVLLGRLGIDGVHALGIAGGAEGEQRKGLRLAAREEGRTVRTRHEAHFAGDRPDLVGAAAVGAPFLDGDAPPDDVSLELGEGPLDLRHALAHGDLVESLREALDDLPAQLGGGVVAGFLVGDRRDPVDLGAVGAHDLVVETTIDFVGRHFPLGLAGELGQPQLGIDELLDLAMGDAQPLEHLLLGGLIGARFDHDDGVATAGDYEIEGGLV